MNKTDLYFIEGILEGREQSLRELHQSCFSKIKTIVTRNSGSVQDAEDVYQNGFLVVFTKISEGKLKLTGRFTDFFVGVCVNLWRNERRKSYRKELTIPDNNTLVDEQMIDQTILEAEQRQLYLKKLKELSSACQKLLTLFLEGLSFEKIVAQLNYKNINAAKVQKHKCQKNLIRRIKEDNEYKSLLTY